MSAIKKDNIRYGQKDSMILDTTPSALGINLSKFSPLGFFFLPNAFFHLYLTVPKYYSTGHFQTAIDGNIEAVIS